MKKTMANFYLNYASYCDNDLHCECFGRFTDEEQVIAERNRLVERERAEYNEDGGNFDDFIIHDTNHLFEWDDGCVKMQYRIQEIY